MITAKEIVGMIDKVVDEVGDYAFTEGADNAMDVSGVFDRLKEISDNKVIIRVLKGVNENSDYGTVVLDSLYSHFDEHNESCEYQDVIDYFEDNL